MKKIHKKILVCIRTPINKNGRKTLNYALKFGKEFNAELHILHIVHDIYKNEVNIEDIKHKTMDMVVTDKNRIRVKIHVKFGDPIKTINKTVRELGCDLLIIGAHRKSFLDSILDGIINMDFSGEIIKNTPCSVLIVR